MRLVILMRLAFVRINIYHLLNWFDANLVVLSFKCISIFSGDSLSMTKQTNVSFYCIIFFADKSLEISIFIDDFGHLLLLTFLNCDLVTSISQYFIPSLTKKVNFFLTHKLMSQCNSNNFGQVQRLI